MWFFTDTLIWYRTHKYKHTTHSGARRLTHPYKYIPGVPEKTWPKQNDNFCVIIDTLYINSFLMLMFFKEELTKSKDIYNWKKYIKTSCSNVVIIWRQNGWSENNNFTATIIRLNKTLKSPHFSGKIPFSCKF